MSEDARGHAANFRDLLATARQDGDRQSSGELIREGDRILALYKEVFIREESNQPPEPLSRPGSR